MPERESRHHLLILPLAAFIAILPLILNGCSCGHDFDFHILNWFEAARQFTHGNLHPYWAYTPAWNAGEPRFLFYPPLSWIIGAILGLLLPWTWTPIVYTWLALTAAGLSLYYLAKEFTTRQAALIAATFYIVNPYMLFTAYERTAYAELLAAAWIPLLLHAILRDRITIPRIAIPVALLWFTNAPAAVMSCYALALLTVIRLIAAKPTARLKQAATTTAGTLLGLGLAAIYILPAAYERRYVHIAMSILPGMRIQDNFLFHHTQPGPQYDPFHDAVLHTASLISLTVIALTVIALLIATRRKPRVSSSLIATLTTLTLAITFLLTPLSAPIWNHTPELLFLQFPWRLLAILTAVMALAIAKAIAPFKRKPIQTTAIALAIAAALTTIAYPTFRQYCDDPDTVASRLTLFHSNAGTNPTDEYTPLTADNDALSPNNPAYWLSPDPTAKAPANSTPAPAPTHLSLNLETPQSLILNLRDYPTWHITRNGTQLTTRQRRKDGLIAIPLPAGQSDISIRDITPPDQILGDILTTLSLILLLASLRRRRAA